MAEVNTQCSLTTLSTDHTSLFAYTLDDGTVGVYNENVRLWRVKVRLNSDELRAVGKYIL